jgi:hypothetical protein
MTALSEVKAEEQERAPLQRMTRIWSPREYHLKPVLADREQALQAR